MGGMRSRQGFVLSSNSGVEVVELAVTLPLVLFLIFGTIDIGRLVAGYSATRVAAAIGTRQAIGQQGDEPAGVGTLMAALTGDYYKSAGADPIAFANNTAFVSSNATINIASAAENPYVRACTGESYAGGIYRYELRAIAMANFLMKANFPSVAYPCAPGQKNCFTCCSLRKSQSLYEETYSLPGEDGQPVYSAKFVSISCSYRIGLFTAAVGLGLLRDFTTVTGSASIPVSNFAGNQFDAR